jgi:hypothetical protein
MEDFDKHARLARRHLMPLAIALRELVDDLARAEIAASADAPPPSFILWTAFGLTDMAAPWSGASHFVLLAQWRSIERRLRSGELVYFCKGVARHPDALVGASIIDVRDVHRPRASPDLDVEIGVARGRIASPTSSSEWAWLSEASERFADPILRAYRDESLRHTEDAGWAEYRRRWHEIAKRAAAEITACVFRKLGAGELSAEGERALPPYARSAIPADYWPRCESVCGNVVNFRGGIVFHEVRVRRSVGPIGSTGNFHPQPELRRALAPLITEKIRSVYDAAVAQGIKPPNLKELCQPVRTLLARDGFQASDQAIQDVASEEEFAARRRPPGARVRDSLLPFSALAI